jgi:hypothetical protein
MSDKSTAVVLASSFAPEMQLVRSGTPLAFSLDAQGIDVASQAAQRAVSKAVTSLAKDLMEGAMLLQADAGHEGAQRAAACLKRVRAERASK